MELVQGARLAERFKVIGSLGTGPTGTTFVAADLARRDAAVVLRVFNPERVRGDESRLRVRRRVELLQRIQHPNLVSVLEFVDDAELTGCVVEYVDGQDLRDLLKSAHVTLSNFLTVLRELLSALSCLYRAGVVHGDLKFIEVLITTDGALKVLPGPIVREASEAQHFEVGSAQYRSPEQLRTGESDPKADLYAVGVIGYELLRACSEVKQEDRQKLCTFLSRLTSMEVEDRPAHADHANALLSSTIRDLGRETLMGGGAFAITIVGYVIVLIAGLLVATQFLVGL